LTPAASIYARKNKDIFQLSFFYSEVPTLFERKYEARISKPVLSEAEWNQNPKDQNSKLFSFGLCIVDLNFFSGNRRRL